MNNHYIQSLENFIKTNANRGLNGYLTQSAPLWWENEAVESARIQLELYKVGKGILQQ